MSDSQSVASFGPSTIAGGLQCMPSSLSTRATLFLGRQENHIRYFLFSRKTATSKHVPNGPPRTGFCSYFRQPPEVSVAPSARIIALGRNNQSPAQMTLGIPLVSEYLFVAI